MDAMFVPRPQGFRGRGEFEERRGITLMHAALDVHHVGSTDGAHCCPPSRGNHRDDPRRVTRPVISPPDRGLLTRNRLLDRIRSAGALATVSLSAPAGYGKTTLLEQWDATDPRPFVWLPLVDDHNDPLMLQRALQHAILSLPVGGIDSRGRPGPPGLTGADPSVLGNRAPAPRGFVLVVDDVHLIDWAAGRKVIDRLLRHRPEMQVAVAGRGVRSVRTMSTGAGRPFVEITSDEMALDRTEVRTALGPPANDVGIRSILQWSEGWPLGIHLTARTFRERIVDESSPDLTEAAEQQAAREVAAQCAELDGADLSYLSRVAILSELQTGLCNVVAGRPGSGTLHHMVRRGDLMISPVDERGQRYRLHPLLRRVLLEELRRAEPESIALFHQRASDWYAAGGDANPAVHHALAAHDMDRIGAIVWARLHPGSTDEELNQSRTWLSGLSDDQIRRSAQLTTAAAWLAQLDGDFEAAKGWRALASARAASVRRADQIPPEALCALRLLQVWQETDSPDGSSQRAMAAWRGLPADSHWRPLAGWFAGMTLAFDGDRAQARELLQEAEGIAHGLGQHRLRRDCLVALAELNDDGDAARPPEADSLSWWAGPTITTPGLWNRLCSPYTTSVLALSQARANDPRAATTLSRAQDLTKTAPRLPAWLGARAVTAQAMTCLLIGEIASARCLARQVRHCLDGQEAGDGVRCEVRGLENLLRSLPPDLQHGFDAITPAEARVLDMLPTHLSFPEIGALLFVSRHTVKSQAVAIYRKLGAKSRSESVERARMLGYLPQAPTTVSGPWWPSPDGRSADPTDRGRSVPSG